MTGSTLQEQHAYILVYLYTSICLCGLATSAAGGGTYCSEQEPQLEQRKNLKGKKMKYSRIKQKAGFKVFRAGWLSHTVWHCCRNKAFLQTPAGAICVLVTCGKTDLKKKLIDSSNSNQNKMVMLIIKNSLAQELLKIFFLWSRSLFLNENEPGISQKTLKIFQYLKAVEPFLQLLVSLLHVSPGMFA